ncbi:hypothetical protein IPH70_02310 [Candidatus Roizmanbacteria bacterium]|nr:MAG: hypothetical protein IPH70_02310 [Candidatus Roizmanbacteria bacterium]
MDDNSTDKTVSLLEALAKLYPIEIHEKVGKRGKARSLIQDSATPITTSSR